MKNNAYSRLVFWLKIVLPLAALGILSTIFLVSNAVDPDDAIPYAQVDVEQLAREPRVTAPSYAGVTDDGTEVLIEAETVTPETATPDNVVIDRLRTLLRIPDGSQAEISAGSGRIDTEQRQLILEDGIILRTSSGYVLKTEALLGSLRNIRLESRGLIEGRGPMGELSAGRMVLEQRAPEDRRIGSDYLLVFNEGVRLLYQPQQAEAEDQE